MNYIVKTPAGYISRNDTINSNFNFAYCYESEQTAKQKAKNHNGKVLPSFRPDNEPPLSVAYIPEGFIDSTYVNDLCPSMMNEKLDLRIYVDYLFEEHRDRPEAPVYAITSENFSSLELLFESNNFGEILDKIEYIKGATDLANTFSELMREELSRDQLRTVKTRNRIEREKKNFGVCHSHDFTDANMIMQQAFQKHGIEPDIQDEDHRELWNLAWQRSQFHDFEKIGL